MKKRHDHPSLHDAWSQQYNEPTTFIGLLPDNLGKYLGSETEVFGLDTYESLGLHEKDLH